VAAQVRPDEMRAAQRAVFEWIRHGAGDTLGAAGDVLFFRAGARWLGPALRARGGDRLLRLAQRLPRPLGEALLAEAERPASAAEQAAGLAETDRLIVAEGEP
jgi:hypothetical protein